MDVYPSLTYGDVRAALEWVAKAFGLEPRVLGARVVDEAHHAAFVHGAGMVLVESERPSELHGSHRGRGWVYVAVDDVDGHFERAKAAGADRPPAELPREEGVGNSFGGSRKPPGANAYGRGIAARTTQSPRRLK